MYKKYKKYQLTYPFEGYKIYESRSFRNAIEKCYKEYKSRYNKEFKNRYDNIFIITDIENNIEYKFKLR